MPPPSCYVTGGAPDAELPSSDTADGLSGGGAQRGDFEERGETPVGGKFEVAPVGGAAEDKSSPSEELQVSDLVGNVPLDWVFQLWIYFWFGL